MDGLLRTALDAASLLPEDWAVEMAELRAIEAEAIGWQPLLQWDEGPTAYLHVGQPVKEEDDVPTVAVVGVADASMAGMNVLWVR